jgi:hypothetical protein
MTSPAFWPLDQMLPSASKLAGQQWESLKDESDEAERKGEIVFSSFAIN